MYECMNIDPHLIIHLQKFVKPQAVQMVNTSLLKRPEIFLLNVTAAKS